MEELKEAVECFLYVFYNLLNDRFLIKQVFLMKIKLIAPILVLSFLFFNFSLLAQSNQFQSQLNERWNAQRNEREVNNEFTPDFEELRKGNMTFVWKHTVKASELKDYSPSDVHIISFNRDDEKVLKDFLKNGKEYINLEAISIGGINLEGETIEQLILELSNKKHFKKLLLGVSYLKKLPSSIGGLKYLETLDLSNNLLHKLPAEIGELSNLRYLCLRNNRDLTELPSGIGQLKKLDYLSFTGTKVSIIPHTIGQCTNLIKIVGNDCKIKILPDEIVNCRKLRWLNLGANEIESIPSDIGNLSQLQSLFLGSNKISKLPKSFEELDELFFCSLDHNKFKEFPLPVLGLSKVQNLWLHENSFEHVPLALSKMELLSIFLVDEPEISKSDLEKIKEQKPNLRIIDED